MEQSSIAEICWDFGRKIENQNCCEGGEVGDIHQLYQSVWRVWNMESMESMETQQQCEKCRMHQPEKTN